MNIGKFRILCITKYSLLQKEALAEHHQDCG